MKFSKRPGPGSDSDSAVELVPREQLDLLARIAVRLSLAAEGLDPALNQALAELRRKLRQEEHRSEDLSQLSDDIEQLILRLDQEQSQHEQGLLDSLAGLINQLLEAPLPSDQRRQLKRYSRELKNRLKSLKDFPPLLREYARLQGEALAHLLSRPQEAPVGLLGRLLGRHEQRPSDPEPPMAAGEALPAEPQETPSGQEQDQADIARHISSSLAHLLSQLPLPESARPQVEEVRQRISGGLNWLELGQAIDKIADLVVAAIGKGQRDFESFLKSLDQRLAALQTILEESHQSHQDRRKSKDALAEAVRHQVNTMSSHVREATDLESLKTSVQTTLDRIIHSVEDFIQTEASREQELDRQLRELQDKLADMERESESIRQRLREEHDRALTDPLTGLPNREAYRERLQLEFDRWRRHGRPLALAIGDIDRFKSINDRFGHLAGDKVIRLVARELRNGIRRTDFVARYGGEEFVLLLPETAAEAAEAVLEKLRRAIEALPFHFQEEPVRVTLSFGLTEFQPGATLDDLFAQADQALYRAKQEGRNRVARADPAQG